MADNLQRSQAHPQTVWSASGEVAEMPNLIEVQKQLLRSDFLMVKEPAGGSPTRVCRRCSGRCSRFSTSPVERTLRVRALRVRAAEIRRRRVPAARHDLRRAAEGDAAGSIVFDVNEETGARSVKDIKEQDVYMGDMPFMTLERHLRHQRHRARHRPQMHRSPRRVLRPRPRQDAFLRQAAVRRPHHSLSRLLARL